MTGRKVESTSLDLAAIGHSGRQLVAEGQQGQLNRRFACRGLDGGQLLQDLERGSVGFDHAGHACGLAGQSTKSGGE